jgi:hypothetical protein
MPHRPSRRGHRIETPPPLAGAELSRHLRALGLETVDEYRSWCREHGFRSATDKSWQEQREERRVAEKEEAQARAQDELLRHVRTLRLRTVEEYRAWCLQHGLSDSLNKSREQRQQEFLLARRLAAETALAGAKRQTRRPEETIQQLYAGKVDLADLRTPYLRKIGEAFAAQEEGLREALLRLLLHAGKHPRLMAVDVAVQRLGPRAGNSLIEGLFALARHHREWLRPVESWQPDSRSARRQFGSLARHLLARYPVPTFMETAWFEGSLEQAGRHQEWFKWIGIGQNIRTADIPLHLTKRMAHCFLEAPDDLLIEGALRYGQVMGLGGDVRLARAVLSTRMGEMLPDEAFWVSVVHFFLNNPMLDTACFGPIVDYIYNQRFVPRIVVAGPDGRPEEEAPPGPPQPEFSMKGRTAAALLRLVEEWHRELAQETRRPLGDWEPSGIESLLLEEGATERGERPRRWTITEILSGVQLREEGKAMSHCVASYANSCAKGHVSVWSMQVQERTQETPRRVMTIAVNNARKEITEARGRCNKLPGERRASVRLDDAPHVLQQWVKHAGLFLPRHVL